MRLFRLSRPRLSAVVVLVVLCIVSAMASAQDQPPTGKKTKSTVCLHDDSGLQLPEGFCATVFTTSTRRMKADF
jgi:hypothetical protein